jgi:CubicO group peptidase (beta-lactamase class C family)
VDTLDFHYPANYRRDALLRRIFEMGPGPEAYRQNAKDAAFCFHYSNEGYSVLGEILARLSDPQESYEGLLQKKLFAPLGIKSGHLITKQEAFEHLGKRRAHQLLPVELGPVMAPAAGAVCTLNDWMTLLRCMMNGINRAPLSSVTQKPLIFREPETFRTLITPQENCFYGAGGLMISKDPPAAYHFGSNGIHSSLAWLELNPPDNSKGMACIVVSTEPFHVVSPMFYFLAQAIQERLTLKRLAQ